MTSEENLSKPDIQSKRTLPANPFPKGNRLWELRSRAGPNPKFAAPEDLWEACCAYFQWVEDNPLWEERAFSHRGKIAKTDLRKMRAMTLEGLTIFIGINIRTWGKWRSERPALNPVITLVEQIIYDQKFTGAAAGLLNANIIARELGLTDKIEGRLQYLGQSGEPVDGEKSEKAVDDILIRALEEVKKNREKQQAEALEAAKEQLMREGWMPR